MRHTKIIHILFIIILILLIVGSTLPAGVCYAGEWALPEYYPHKFDGKGYIDKIAKDEIVIDDCSYRFSSFVTFATPTNKHASRSQFCTGDLVGYIVNQKKQIESLYLLKK